MTKLVTIFGGSGFLGRYIARRMAKDGWRVRVAVRRPNEAGFVRTYGAVGQVEPVLCNIRDDASVAAALAGADAAVNCVGTFDARGRNNFFAVQHDGAARVARLATAGGVDTLVHISAIGADAAAESLYARSKAEGEQAVLAHFPNAYILRPSVIFGQEDGFFNRFAAMSRFGPVLPIVGGDTRFQPVYVDDVAAAAQAAIQGAGAPGTYEVAGPDVNSFSELMAQMLQVIHRRRLVVSIPFWAARIMAFFMDMGQIATGGLFSAPITRDQVKSLQTDNVAAEGAKGLRDLGVTPTALEVIIPTYLYRFRPAGQYDAIKDSARNLKA